MIQPLRVSAKVVLGHSAFGERQTKGGRRLRLRQAPPSRLQPDRMPTMTTLLNQVITGAVTAPASNTLQMRGSAQMIIPTASSFRAT